MAQPREINKPMYPIWKIVSFWSLFLLLSFKGLVYGEDLDWSEGVNLKAIPEAIGRKVDFKSEVWPILDRHCIKCHGSSKPQSGYRMTSRELAIESGDYGGNIIVGDGFRSPLIHFVAYAIEDWEMPPIDDREGNKKLSLKEISILRAWIDQGVEWEEVSPQVVSANVKSTARIWWVEGNKNQFRQLQGYREDDGAGLTSFSLNNPVKDGAEWYLNGSVWDRPDEYKLSIGYDQPSGIWFESGIEQWKSFDTATGGYWSQFSNPAPVLPGIIAQTHKDFYFKWGIQSDDGPSLSVSYNIASVDGQKSLTSFGPVAQMIGSNYTLRSIRPATKDRDNQVHRLDILLKSSEDTNLYWEDQATIVWQSLDETRSEYASFGAGVPSPEERVDRRDTWDSLRGSNSIRMLKKLDDMWQLSLGHSFALMEGESVFAENFIGLSSPFSFQGPVGQGIILNQHSQMGNVNLSSGPWFGAVNFTSGIQFDWLTQDGEGQIIPFPGANPQTLDTGWDQTRFTEYLRANYTGLKKQTIYVETRFRQMGYDQSELLETVVNRMTEADHRYGQYSAGWQMRPHSKLGIHLRGKLSHEITEFNHPLDQEFGVQGNGYPAFLRDRYSESMELDARISWRPHSQLQFEKNYKWAKTDFETTTDAARDFSGSILSPGGNIDSAEYETHTTGLTMTWTPAPRVHGTVHGNVTRWDMASQANGFAGVSPFKGWTWWAGTYWSYILNTKTNVFFSGDINMAHFFDGDSGFAFAHGLDYLWKRARAGIHHKLRPNFSAFAEYSFSIWDQPSFGGFNDFEAHGIFIGFDWDLEVEKKQKKSKN